MKRALICVASAFATTLAFAAAQPAANQPSVIVIYDQPDFKGRSVTIDKPIPDLAALNFNDRVASFSIKGSSDWVLCENINFGGRCVRVQAQAQDLTVLRLTGRVSSLYSTAAAP